MIEKVKFQWYYMWILSLLLLALGKSYEFVYTSFGHSHGQVIQSKANHTIASLYKDLEYFDNKFIQVLSKEKHEEGEILDQVVDFFSDKKPDYYFILCHDNKLLFWNKPGVYYSPNWCPCSAQSIGQGIFLQNGIYYYGLKNKFEKEEDTYCYILYKELMQESLGQDTVIIHKDKSKLTPFALNDNTNTPIAYINNLGTQLSAKHADRIIFYYLILLFIYYYPFHFAAKNFFQKKQDQWAYLTLLFGVMTTVSLSQWIVHQHDFYHSFLTNAKIQTGFIDYTLFEFVILSILVFHLTYFFYKFYKIPTEVLHQEGYTKFIIPIINYGAVFLSLIVFCSTSKAIFVNSSLGIDLGNVIFMPLQNYIILFILLCLLLAIFLISNKLCLSTISFGISLRERLICFLIGFILSLPFLIGINLDLNIFTFFLGASILIWLQDYFADEYQPNTLWLISWILVISFLSSGIIFHYQNIRKRQIELNIYKDFLSQQATFIADSTYSNNNISNTISAANKHHVDFYFFEDGIIKYASNIQKPNYKECLNLVKKDSINRVVYNSKDVLIVKPKESQLLVFAHPVENIVNGISLFSYLFTLLIILSYSIHLVQQKYPFLPEGIQIKLPEKPSLRNRIQFYVILGIVFSFLVIALVTVFFTKKSEQNILEETLTNKIKNIGDYFNQQIKEQLSIEDAYLILTSRLKEGIMLYDFPIELYDQNGQIINYTNPVIAKNDTKIKLCDPRFYFNYTQDIEDVIIQPNTENNGSISFAAFKNIFFNNQRIGTIQINSALNMISNRNENNRLAVLINTLLNIYVFLFLIAAALATLLANSITSPLEVLANKLKQIRLGKRNEPLEWSGQDEIGELINDYNNMISQLDESAILLAKSERDSAWREMAKQVAHEIKNPLTPMKLNLQYLQQALRIGDQEKIQSMADRVSNTLLEQIDGLTKIATEFSNFAKMPQAENERLLLNDILTSVHDLFRKRDDIEIHLNVPFNEHWIYSDKNQIIRVLNNLINNAIQSIPEHRTGRIDIALEEKDKMCLISIKDNGSGIPANMEDKVFLPNFTTKNSGTGLGLAMCRQIVENANGRIYFKTVINEGTTFFVELPMMKNLE